MIPSLSYRRFVFAIVSIVGVALLSCSVHAQDCTQNMLTISGPNSYISTPGITALNLTHGFTIECWARAQPLVNNAALIDKKTYGIFLQTDSSIMGSITHITNYTISSPKNDSLGNWHHYAFVFTPGDSLRMYVDTVEVGSEKAPIASLDSNTDSLRIGMSIAGTGFLGSIDEVRIWNIPRSLANIEQTLTHVLQGTDSGLVLYYPFDDVEGSKRVHDFSNHGRDGYVQGANASIVPSTSPMIDAAPGFAVATVEQRVIIPTLRCRASFDTVIHVRNLGTVPILVDTVGFRLGVAFSIVPNTSFTLPADSNLVDSLRLHFEPNTGGVYDDSLYIASASDCGGRTVIGIHAAYDSVGLHSNPDTLNFGLLDQCQLPATRKLTLTNTSVTDSVTILDVIAPPGVQVNAKFPISLAARQDTAFNVSLLPGTRGSLTASLAFDLNKCSQEAIVSLYATRALAQLAVSSMDFGNVSASLAGVSKDTTITVTNSGDVVNKIESISVTPDSILDILDGRTGYFIDPGDTLQVHVRLHSFSCGRVSTQLTIKGFACQTDTVVTVSMTVVPPSPVTASPLNVGTSCLPRDTIIYISNPNDIPVDVESVVFSAPNVFTTDAFSPLLIAPHDSALLQLDFDPVRNGVYLDTAYFTMLPCGTGSTVFSGTMGFAGVPFSASQLLFGRGCTLDTVTAVDTITNTTPDTVTFLTNTYSGSLRFSVVPFPFPFVLPPNASKTISVQYIPTLDALDTGTFTFVTADGCPASEFTLRGSREIAQAKWNVAIGNFDTVCPGNTIMKTFTLTNHGIDSIDVLSAAITGSAFSLVERPKTIGTTGSFEIAFNPIAGQNDIGMLTVIVDSCGTKFSLPLIGSGGPKPELILDDSTLFFDTLLVSDSEERCVFLTNPSCEVVNIQLDSTTLVGTPFQLVSGLNTTQLSRSDTARFCIQFRPSAYGTFSASIPILSDSVQPDTLHLTATGLAPDIRFAPHLLDFGYVLLDSTATLSVHDTNAGNLAAVINATNNNTIFSVTPPVPLPAETADSFAVTFQPIAIGLFYDTIHLSWSGHDDSVILRGIGTEKGLQGSATELDFGNVHVAHDSSLPLYLFARNNFPTVSGISLDWITPSPNDTFSYTGTVPHTITNARDTLALQITYHARLEQRDTAQLIVHAGADSTIVLLTGRGVEAHPKINPPSFNFPQVLLGQTGKYESVTIQDTGDYPLYIDSIFVTNPAFAFSTISPSQAILPDSIYSDTITFTPSSTLFVSGILGFRTSYRDSILSVDLSGNGIYPAGSGPTFGFSVASRNQEVPGQLDTIPVTMNGANLSEVDTDHVTLVFRFDPLEVMMRGADAGFASESLPSAQPNDSTIEVSEPIGDFQSGTIMRLYTEALLGPHDTSYIHVINSLPDFDRPESATDGLFAEVDCGGPVVGVIFAGPYSTSAIVPNPADDQVQLQFELGFDGPVSFDLFNSIGQTVKHVDLGTLNEGSNSLTLDISDMPQGEYLYRLTSLEYRSEGALAIVR